MTFIEAYQERQRIKSRLHLLRFTVDAKEYASMSKRVKVITQALRNHTGQAYDTLFLPQE